MACRATRLENNRQSVAYPDDDYAVLELTSLVSISSIKQGFAFFVGAAASFHIATTTTAHLAHTCGQINQLPDPL